MHLHTIQFQFNSSIFIVISIWAFIIAIFTNLFYGGYGYAILRENWRFVQKNIYFHWSLLILSVYTFIHSNKQRCFHFMLVLVYNSLSGKVVFEPCKKAGALCILRIKDFRQNHRLLCHRAIKSYWFPPKSILCVSDKLPRLTSRQAGCSSSINSSRTILSHVTSKAIELWEFETRINRNVKTI